MKHKGKAKAAFRRMMIRALGIYWVLGFLLIAINRFLVPGLLIPGVISLTGLLLGFALFAGYFFRDPDAQVPVGNGLIVSPGHGTVDVIDETDEPSVMGGRCRRVSIFLSVFNVHVQQAPVAGHAPPWNVPLWKAHCQGFTWVQSPLVAMQAPFEHVVASPR